MRVRYGKSAAKDALPGQRYRRTDSVVVPIDTPTHLNRAVYVRSDHELNVANHIQSLTQEALVFSKRMSASSMQHFLASLRSRPRFAAGVHLAWHVH